eukprot:3081731-Amphidinium_carterae.1
MDECTKSATIIQLSDIQDKYTTNEVKKCNTTYLTAPRDGEDGYDDYMDMTVNIKEDERRHCQFQPDIELRVATCYKARQ